MSGLVARSAEMAQELLGGSGTRWEHVGGVARSARRLRKARPSLGPEVESAAWLHDIGYADAIRSTGFHPLDGANLLLSEGFPNVVVGLVAFHSGAEYEAEERGLADELGSFARPPEALLDALNLVDLTVGPDGSRVGVAGRIREILGRYPEEDPVHRAVTRSQLYLMESAERAAIASGSPQEWGFAVA